MNRTSGFSSEEYVNIIEALSHRATKSERQKEKAQADGATPELIKEYAGSQHVCEALAQEFIEAYDEAVTIDKLKAEVAKLMKENKEAGKILSKLQSQNDSLKNKIHAALNKLSE